MAQTIKLKRSATAGNTPTTSQLALGELGINTTDGKLFLKKSVSGTESIVDVGGLPLTGGTLTGNLNLGDNVKATFGDGDDLEIFSNGSTALLKAGNATSDIRIESDNRIVIADRGFNEAFAIFNDDSDVKLYHDGSPKIATTSYGADITGRLVTTSHIDAPDNAKIRLGDGDDLQIYHDGSNSYIQEAGSGNLYIQGSNAIRLRSSASLENMLEALENGAVTLYHNNSPKIATTASGADITGVLRADEIKVGATDRIYLDGGSNTYIQESASDDLRFFVGGQQAVRVRTFGTDILGTVTADGLTVDGTGYAYLGNTAAYRGELNYDSSGNTSLTIANSWDNDNSEINFKVKTAGTGKKALQIKGNGDISFYDGSANQGLFWDSSASRLGLGTTSLTHTLHVTGSHNEMALFKRSVSGNSEVKIDTTTAGDAKLTFANNGTSEYTMGRDNSDGAFKIADGGTIGSNDRLTINADGSSVFSGAVTADGLLVGDNEYIYAGNGADLKIGHDGSSNVIRSQGHPLYIDSNGITFRGYSPYTNHMNIASNGDISFYNDSAAQGFHYDSSESVLSLGRTNGSSYVTDSDSLYVKGQIRVDGISNTAALPALCFNDTNTGIFYPAVNSIGFSVGAYESLRLNADGSSKFSGSLDLAANTSFPTAGFTLHTNGFLYNKMGSNGFIFSAQNGTEAMRINSGGTQLNIPNGSLMVGATTAPDRKLHVKDSNYRVAVFERTGSANSYIVLKDPNTTTDVGIGATTNDLKFRSGNSDNMSLSSSGNLNIPNGSLMVGSTTAPTARLHLKSASRGSFALRVTDSDTTNDILRSGSQADGDGFLQLRTVGGAGNVLFDASGDSYVNGGNFGIGESIPTEKLHVGGNIKMQASTAIVTYQNAVNTWNVGLDAADASFKFKDGTDERLRIDASGNLGIGRSPVTLKSSTTLQVSGNAKLGDDNGRGLLSLGDINSTGANVGIWRGAAGAYAGVGNYLNLGGYDGITFTTGASEIASQTERLRIDSQGRVGIGTATFTGANSYMDDLVVYNATSGSGAGLSIIANATNGYSNIAFGDTADWDTGRIQYNHSDNSMALHVNSAERTRIASNGTLYHGKTADSLNTGGLQTLISGQTSITQDHNEPLRLNRMSSQGAIQKFYYNGGEVGSIGTKDSFPYFVGTSIGLRISGTQIRPSTSSGANNDNAVDLGKSDTRFKDLYLSNNATAQKLTLTKAPVGLFTIEVDGTNTGQPNLIVKKSTSEALRIDNNNNLLVGKTSSAINTDGVELLNSGRMFLTTTSLAHVIRRKSTDGALVEFSKDTAPVGSIGTASGVMYFGSGDVALRTNSIGDAVEPFNTTNTNVRDALIDLGSSGARWKDLYLSGGVIGGGAIRSYAGTAASPAFRPDNDLNCGIFFPAANTFAVTADGSEAYRVDPFGNLLVGKTSLDFGATSGQEFRADGRVFIGHSGAGHFVNRIGSNGAISEFRKDGTTVGSIQSRAGIVSTIVLDPRSGQGAGLTGAGAGGDTLRHITPTNESGVEVNGKVSLGNSINGFRDLYLSGKIYGSTLGIGDAGIQADQYSNAVKPFRPDITSGTSDNYLDLGTSSVRWVDIYATNGTIQTSDRNEKQDIEDLTEAEERVAMAAKGLLKKFRWKSAVEEKGDDARIHFGIIAQDLQDAFEAEGLDAGRYGMFISTTWTDEDGEEQTRMGVRYSELLAFIISAI